MNQLPAYIATKDEITASNIPGDAQILYVVLGQEENAPVAQELVARAAVRAPPAPQRPIDALNARRGEGAKSKKRGRPQAAAKAGVQKRKRTPLELWQRCCSNTAKSRCKYGHSSRAKTSDEVLAFLESAEDNVEELVCKKHGKIQPVGLNVDYVQESIVALTAAPPAQAPPAQAPPAQAPRRQEEQVEIDDFEAELLQQMDEEVDEEVEEEEEEEEEEPMAAVPQTWEENVSELVANVKKGIFVVGQDTDGSNAMPAINGEGTGNMFLVAWSFKRNCGILYMTQQQAFWYVTLDAETKEMKEQPKLIEENELTSVLKQFVNVPNAQ